MKIKHLGTAAAERIPGIFCECELCRAAREQGGREIRTQSQAIINDELLIDFPGDTYLHYLRDRFPLPAVRSLLVTHWHSDHFYGEDVAYRMGGYVVDNPTAHLEVYGSAVVQGFYERAFFLEARHDDDRVSFTTVRPGDDFSLPGGYRCRAFLAAHAQHAGDALFYSITGGRGDDTTPTALPPPTIPGARCCTRTTPAGFRTPLGANWRRLASATTTCRWTARTRCAIRHTIRI